MKGLSNSKNLKTEEPFRFKQLTQVSVPNNSMDYELPKNAFCVNNNAVPGNARYIMLAYYDLDDVRHTIDPFYAVSLNDANDMVAFAYNDLSTPIVVHNIKKICARETLSLGQQYINIYEVGA